MHMSASLLDALRLSPKEKSAITGFAGKIKGVSEFLAEAFSKAGKMGFVRAIEDSTPWFGAVVEAGEAFPAVKFVVTLFSKLTEEHDPAQLAFLACTLAYERSIEQAVTALGLATVPDSLDDRELAARLKVAQGDSGSVQQDVSAKQGTLFKLESFSFGDALLHPFVKEPDRVLDRCAQSAGHGEQQR